MGKAPEKANLHREKNTREMKEEYTYKKWRGPGKMK